MDPPVFNWAIQRYCGARKDITVDAALSIRMEKKVGKDANLTVLDERPFELPLTQLKDIKVWGTMLEGRFQPAPAAPGVNACRSGAGIK